jgi:putative NADH-flavin reductase
MKLAIFGATGKTGGHAMHHALDGGHHVRVLVRTPAKLETKHERLEVVQGDATKQADCANVVAGCDAVIAALGPEGLGATTLRQDCAKAISAGMAGQGVKRIVWLSAFGVGDSMDQMRRTTFIGSRIFVPLLLKKTYVDAKAAEDVLRASDLDFVLCRPPELTNGASKRELVAIPADEKVPRLRTTREDVAAWMLKAATTGAFDRQAPVIC